MPLCLLRNSKLTAQGVSLKIEGYWLASGILGVTASILKRIGHAGADAVVTKSIGKVPRKGHQGPVLTTSHGGLLNAVGLTNPGIDEFAEEMNLLTSSDVPVVLSIFGSSIDETVEVACKGANLGPDAIELNLSCPHAEISQISHDPLLTHDYVEAVKSVVNCQVFAKISPNVSDIVAIGKAAEKAGADAVVAINTLKGMKIDIQQKRPVLGNKIGGLSGPPIFPIAIRAVYELYECLSIPIIGVGGVSSWEDAVEMHLAGASAIQIGSALLQGMSVFREIREGVQQYLKTQGFSRTSEIIGIAGEK
ncbi:MAG: dihydroorotate dehydrogenase [Candidatus Thorarchaeota archaeon]|nr:dihydroorotate dehydrogenase [Candidatus Thorarchaeota archaeon]